MKRLFILLLAFLPLGMLFSQTTRTVKGTVTEENGTPIMGAYVLVKGTSIGTTTDFDGNFTLNVPADVKTLSFTYIGMDPQDVPVQDVMKVSMSSGTEQLEEVVVTGMLRMDKRLFTGATDRLDADKARLDGVPDVSRALEGRSAGVSVQNVSGTFGTAPKIRVRGATSIYGNSRPLWVVDGVVMEDAVDVSADQLSSGDAVTLISSAIAGLNADDIESFQILKDGSATSIYGARAMAGVVVITTKKGQSGVSKINYTGEFSTRLKPNYRNFNISNSQEQMGIYREMEGKGWLEFANLANGTSSGVYGKMYNDLKTYDPVTGTYLLQNAEAAMNIYLQNAEFRNTDWFDLLFNNTMTQNHAISITGGTDKARFYASLSGMHDPGWTKASSVQRYTTNLNASYDISKKVTLSFLANASYRNQKAPGTLGQETDIVSGQVKRGFDINPYSFAMNTSRTMESDATYKRNYSDFNIFKELDNNYIGLGIADMKFQTELNYKVIPGLELNGLAAIRYQTTTQEHFIKDHSNQALAYRAGIEPENAAIRLANPYLYTDPDDPLALPETVLPEGGIYFRNDYSILQADFRGTVTYNSAFGGEEQHIISLFAGAESNLTDRNSVAFQGWGYCYDDGGIPSPDPSLFKQMKEENTDYYGNGWTYGRSLAGFAMATYSYRGRYTLNLTGRYEGTNKLGKSRQARWLPTYNISGAWNLHEENWFMRSPEQLLSHMTLKASYSLTADRGPSYVSNAEPIYRSYKPWRPLSSVAEVGMRLEDIANSELTYEKKYEYNVGTELGFWKNRVNLALDAYMRDNFDLIGIIYTQGAGGFISKYANVANMDSKGVEATISTKNIVAKDFTWTTDLTFSWVNNKITSLDSRSRVIDLVVGTGYALEGYPVRSIFSIPFEGLNEEGLPTFTNQDGVITISDINFQEFESLDFLKYEGPTDPTMTGGFGNLFTYKGFRLNTFITYSFGNKVRLDPVFSVAYSDMTALPKEFRNRWVVPGDENKTTIPVIASRRQTYNDKQLHYAYNAYNYSTARIADGGFIRMKEISLSYDFKKNVLDALHVSNFQLKLQATNLFLIYADKKLNGQDPEFMNSGGVATPMPKQFTLTVRLGI
jgi:TonB-linked SusC/RagA family outer membrane protein